MTIYSVLLISSGEKLRDAAKELLPSETFFPVTTSSYPTPYRTDDFDLTIINATAGSYQPENLAVRAADNGEVILLLIPADEFDCVRARVMQHGVLTLKKPFSKHDFVMAADFMCAIAERRRRINSDKYERTEKIEDYKLISRAKLLLIENLQMTEAEAHRYIERQAMDRCIRKRDVAESIIKTYKTI